MHLNRVMSRFKYTIAEAMFHERSFSILDMLFRYFVRVDKSFYSKILNKVEHLNHFEYSNFEKCQPNANLIYQVLKIYLYAIKNISGLILHINECILKKKYIKLQKRTGILRSCESNEFARKSHLFILYNQLSHKLRTKLARSH